MMQSESVMKSLGMNSKAIFYPGVRMGRVLKETANNGTSRIEITYTALSREAENEFFYPYFSRQAHHDLDKAFLALNSVANLGWRVPIKELFEKFIHHARGHQLLIVLPSIVGMVYAANSKPSCFTGFWKAAQPGRSF